MELVKNYNPKSIRGSAIDRFNIQVLKTDSCWIWLGSVNKDGYGNIRNDEGKSIGVHKWSYEYHVSVVPDGLELDHTCHNTRCCNPKHLEPVTHQQNIVERGVGNVVCLNSKKTSCVRGHPLTEGNFYVEKGKHGPVRRCKKCQNQKTKKYAANKNKR